MAVGATAASTASTASTLGRQQPAGCTVAPHRRPRLSGRRSLSLSPSLVPPYACAIFPQFSCCYFFPNPLNIIPVFVFLAFLRACVGSLVFSSVRRGGWRRPGRRQCGAHGASLSLFCARRAAPRQPRRQRADPRNLRRCTSHMVILISDRPRRATPPRPASSRRLVGLT